MARGRRPTSTEPSRGTLASRAFRDRRKQEKIDLEREVSRLQKIIESLEEENEALRSGRPVPNPSSSSSTSTSSAKKRRLSVISSSSSTQPNQHLCSSCGGIAKTDEDEEMAGAESADTISSRRSRAKSSKSRSGGSTSRSTVSDNSSATSSSIRNGSSSSKSNVTSPKDTKSDGGDGEERSLALESGFQPQLWNPPQFGFPISNSNLESSNGLNPVQRPHTSGGFSLNHILEPNPSSLARLAQGQILHNPSFQNPAFQFFVNQPVDLSQMNGVQSTQQIINGQPIQTYQTSSGSSIHPPPPHFHHHSGSTANQPRKLWQTGPDVNSSTELDRESSSNFTHARSSSLGRNELCNNAFGALDANSCCWGLLNCGDERSSNNFRESAFPFPRLQ